MSEWNRVGVSRGFVAVFDEVADELRRQGAPNDQVIVAMFAGLASLIAGDRNDATDKAAAAHWAVSDAGRIYCALAGIDYDDRVGAEARVWIEEQGRDFAYNLARG